ncbi:MAG: aldose 1-epimerase family protein [Candidatus Dormibacteria bacterium]
MDRLPSGEQYRIVHGDQQATIVEVGGGVREYTQGGRPVLDPYDATSMCDGAHGTPLIPWPNRLADGRYRFDGRDYQVALTEPAKHTAIHGFLRWAPWTAIRHDRDAVVMAATVFPQTGYPFLLDVAVEYHLTGECLVVTTTATNAGESACPYGCGQHPYLSPGSGLLDECDLELAAEMRITTDEVRQLPTGTQSVDSTPFDFRTRRRIGSLHIDFAFTDLARDGEGRAWVRLWGADGRCAELWVDEGYDFVEIYTGDTLAPERRRRGLGTEPMSCPPNAFQSGEGVIRLEPGASVTTRWGARLSS